MTRRAQRESRWRDLEDAIVRCRACRRLAEHVRRVAREKRRMYRQENYWGKAVPGFGDRDARILILGLAPDAHGANRTGRMFTGDRSGEWLYGALRWFQPLLAGAVLLVLSCAEAPPPATSAAPADVPTAGGTARVGVLQEPSIFVDWSPRRTGVDQMAAHLVFRRLVRPGDGRDGFLPDLAETWEVGDDARSLTFRLRPGFTWEDGRPVTSADVVFTIRRAARPGAPDSTSSIAGVEAPNESTVVFRFRRPHPAMLHDVAVHHIYPSHILEGVSDEELVTHPFNRTPVGSGPFRVEERRPQQYVSFVARDGGPLPRAPLDRLVLRVFSGKEAALRELEGENVDVLFRVPREHADRLEALGGFEVYRFERPSYFLIAWNARRPRWRPAAVRRALTAFIDREALAAELQGDADSLCQGPVPRNHPWYERLPEWPSGGVDEPGGAAELAAAGWDRTAAGWVDAEREPVVLELISLAGNVEYRSIATVVADNLRTRGIAAELRELELARFRARLAAGEFDGVLIARGGPGVDLQSCFGSGGQDNYGGFGDPELDRLLADYAAAGNLADAQAAFGAASRRIAVTRPWTFLYYRAGVIVARPRLRGVTLDPEEPLSMADRWWVR